MANDGTRMRRALERGVIAGLRAAGFTGAWPHFRRRLTTRIDLVTIRFDKWGGGFYVAIAVAPPSKLRPPIVWFAIAAAKVTAEHVVDYDRRVLRQWRLGARARKGNHWYRYDKSRAAGRFDALAAKVDADLARQAEPFWRTARFRPML